MIALSVKQPWAHLIAIGRKTIETRTWNTAYRGPILICAGMNLDKAASSWAWSNVPQDEVTVTGMAVAVANLAATGIMAEVHEAAAFCDAFPGLFAWRFDCVQRIKPFPVRGQLGLFKHIVQQGQILPYN